MHYLRLVDSIVLLFPSPLTIHKLHPLFHPLLHSTSLSEAEAILSAPHPSEIHYLYSDGLTGSGSPIASFYFPEQAAFYFPELLL